MVEEEEEEVDDEALGPLLRIRTPKAFVAEAELLLVFVDAEAFGTFAVDRTEPVSGNKGW